MIKLFRKTRQKLLMQNKTSQYFKYAIGEVVLVMIGILLALQVNNWNEKRIERNEVRAKLNRVLEEIETNKNSINNNINQVDSVLIFNNRKTLKYLNSKNRDSIQLLNNTLGSLGDTRSIVINSPSIDDFIKSGYLSKISNPDLKELFIIIETLKTFSKTLDQYAINQLNIHITPYFLKSLNLAQLSQNKNRRMIPINIIKDFSVLIGDRELENLLNLKIETDTNVSDFLKSTRTIYEKLALEIKKELGIE